MPVAPSPEPEATAREFVQQWFALLADQRWSEALAQLDAPTSYGQRWTQASIEAVLASYGEGRSRITLPALASGSPHWNTGQFNDGSGFWLDCDLPLDGAWSDLSAQFEFKANANGYSVALQDIHVL